MKGEGLSSATEEIVGQTSESRVVSTPRGDALLQRRGRTWFIRGDDFGATAPDGRAKDVFTAAFGIIEGARVWRLIDTTNPSGSEK
jgi:hypothetical protein